MNNLSLSLTLIERTEFFKKALQKIFGSKKLETLRNSGHEIPETRVYIEVI